MSIGSAGTLRRDALYDDLNGKKRDMIAVNLADAKTHLSELIE
jgi:hypothetical protein